MGSLHERVDALEKRVAFLEKQLSQRQTADVKPDTAVCFNQQTAGNAIHREQVIIPPETVGFRAEDVQPVIHSSGHRVYASNGQLQPKPQTGQQIRQQPPKHYVADASPSVSQKNMDVESFVGKNVLVVVASVLIFVGLIVFAAAVMPYMSDYVKFGAMVAGSVLLTGAGYYFVRKKNTSFNVSLLACGLGALYITLFTGKIYFKFIDDIPLYVSLLIWCFIIYYCSKYKSLLFNIIGQAGILISLTLGSYSVIKSHDVRFIIYLSVYIVIAELVYNVLYKATNYLVNAISALISVFILMVPVFSSSFFGGNAQTRDNFIPVIALFLIIGYIMARNISYAKDDSISKLGYEIVCYLSLFSFTGVFARVWNDLGHLNDTVGLIILAVFSLILMALTEYVYWDDEDVSLTIMDCVFTIFAMIMLCCITDSVCSVLIIPFVLAFYFSRVDHDRARIVFYVTFIAGIIFSTCYMSFIHDVINVERLEDFSPTGDYTYSLTCEWNHMCYLITGIVMVLAICTMIKPKKVYEKICVYLSLVCVLFFQVAGSTGVTFYSWDLARNVRHVLLLLIIVVMQFGAKKYKGFIDWDKPLFSQGTFVSYFVVNAFSMVCALSALHSLSDDMFFYFIAVVLTVGLFSLNVSDLITSENSLMSVYLGIKFVVLIIAVSNTFGYKPVTSILMFAWAFACIQLGVKYHQKPLRLYALVLALLSTIKLLMFDVNYDNLVMRAFSLILCGLLCFGISMFYNRIEKANKKVVNDDSLSMDTPADDNIGSVDDGLHGECDYYQGSSDDVNETM